jgi:hypothetical protein
MKTSHECNCLKAIELIKETHKQHELKGLSLKEKLIQNRSRQNNGSGSAYWDSVVEVVEKHYGIKK